MASAVLPISGVCAIPGRLRDPSPGVGDAIVNAVPGAGAPGGAGSYEGWTLLALRRRASELDVAGRSAMGKVELIRALRARSGR